MTINAWVYLGPAYWWLSGDVNAANCLAAYQPKGAADLAGSYVNLANPGTYDAAAGSAPSFNTATGWTFNGSSEYLTTGLDEDSKPFSCIARLIATGTTGYRAIIGDNSAGIEWRVNETALDMSLLKQAQANLASSSGSISEGADTIVAVTYASDGAYAFYINGASSGTGTSDTTFSGTDGLKIANGPATEWWNGSIKALAFYNYVLTPTQVSAIGAAMAAL